MQTQTTATLILEDGKRFEGYAFGSQTPTSGEIVFNTAMTGYPESLTDPSYLGEILVLTFPLIGNYGVPDSTIMEWGLPQFFESNHIHVRGLVISDYCFHHSHWNAIRSLDQWMKDEKIPGIFGVDTREITKTIREQGVMLAKMCYEGQPEPASFENPLAENLVAKASSTEVKSYGEGANKIVMVDCGAKFNIIRCLLKRDTTVTVVPWDYDFTTLDYDGVMVSNGPGDPALCSATVANLQKAFEVGKPIFGICMGNQLLGMAAGATTYKLKYGHRSHNQPALECGTNRAVITSQNHGYAIDPAGLGADWEPYFVNLNDNTIEGIRHKSQPFCSVQFHPEATSGPVDTEYLFDEFIARVENFKK
ncbi:MAG: glutamine-hydrolyzing carbamoyl-phosphate synthase small subunit [Rikenellaceae bacterium]